MNDDKEEKAIRNLQRNIKLLPEYVSLHFEQYKSLTTPLTVLIAVNTGLAYFAWNLSNLNLSKKL